MGINYYIERLIQYGIKSGLVDDYDEIEVRNKVLEILKLDDFNITIEEKSKVREEELKNPQELLDKILDNAYERGIIKENGSVYRDLLDSKVMGALTPSTSTIIRKFNKIKENISLEEATNYYYNLSKSTNYIRTERIAKNQHWYSLTEYGNLEITINLSKPEKDPKAIALAKTMVSSSYPKCLLCIENVGYSGRVNHPARQNHRVMPLELQGKQWYLQYSPYVYYNEHSIVFSKEHTPMTISGDTFNKLLEFTEVFPHYFCGSNADLPIVGGSILSHDHFQGGRHEFPMDKAEIEKKVSFKGFEDVDAGIVKWPMSVIRLAHKDRKKLSALGEKILSSWRGYTDSILGIYSHTEDTPHNTVTPIARMREGQYELDLVLRNNKTTTEYPMGIFHPHQEVHHIKKENIGLIEVMGLAILPGRLKEEMELISGYLMSNDYKILISEDERVLKHFDWCVELVEEKSLRGRLKDQDIEEVLREEIGIKFANVLEHAGVYKTDEEGREGFLRFIEELNK